MLMEEARDFIESLPRPAANKIYYNIRRVVDGERDADLFKKLTGTKIWEFRTLYGNMTYRLFAFWDTRKEMLVVVTHGIVKKVQKTRLTCKVPCLSYPKILEILYMKKV